MNALAYFRSLNAYLCLFYPCEKVVADSQKKCNNFSD